MLFKTLPIATKALTPLGSSASLTLELNSGSSGAPIEIGEAGLRGSD